MVVISYVRPWNIHSFTSIAQKAFPEAEIISASDFKGLGDLQFQDYIARINDLPEPKNGSELNYQDINERCRLLRALPYEKSKGLIDTYWKIINYLFDQHKPEAILSLTVDSYVIDLIRIYAFQNKIPFIGFVVSFANGYFRLTERGERIETMQPTENDIEALYESMVVKKSKPKYMEGKLDKNVVSTFVKNKIRNNVKYIYFSWLRLTKDPICYHYWANQVLVKNSRNPLPEKIDYLSNLDCLRGQNKKLIYLPLQFFPEATIDYWVNEIEHIAFEDTIEKIANSLDPKYALIVKEHPAVIGLRRDGFYSWITKFKNVHMVPSLWDSQEMIESTDCTLTWTGTAGFESALKGKPTICLTKPYYFIPNRMIHLHDIGKINEILEKVETKHEEAHISKADQEMMLRSLLESNVKGKFHNPKKVKGVWDDQIEDIDTVARSVRNYFDSI